MSALRLVNWVDNIFTVFTLCILVRILLSWVQISPIRGVPRAIMDFFHDVTDWYLRFFRRIIPAVGPLDLSPIVALLVVFVVQRFVEQILLRLV